VENVVPEVEAVDRSNEVSVNDELVDGPNTSDGLILAMAKDIPREILDF
jgi:hypothetical protein